MITVIETEVGHQNLLHNRWRIRHLGKVIYRKHFFCLQVAYREWLTKGVSVYPCCWSMHEKLRSQGRMCIWGQRERMRTLEWKKTFSIQDSLLPWGQMRLALVSSYIQWSGFLNSRDSEPLVVSKILQFPHSWIATGISCPFSQMENAQNEVTLRLRWSAGERDTGGSPSLWRELLNSLVWPCSLSCSEEEVRLETFRDPFQLNYLIILCK